MLLFRYPLATIRRLSTLCQCNAVSISPTSQRILLRAGFFIIQIERDCVCFAYNSVWWARTIWPSSLDDREHRLAVVMVTCKRGKKESPKNEPIMFRVARAMSGSCFVLYAFSSIASFPGTHTQSSHAQSNILFSVLGAPSILRRKSTLLARPVLIRHPTPSP